MSFKMSKASLKQRGEYVQKLRDKRAEIEAVVHQMNMDLRAMLEEANLRVSEYNEILTEAQGFAADMHSDWESDYEDKSDTWKEGERGEAVSAMLEQWQEFAQIDTLDVLEGVAVEVDGFAGDDPADTLEGLPEAPDA